MFTLGLTRKRLEVEVYLKLKTFRSQIYQSHWTLSFCLWCSPFWMQGRYDKDMLVGPNETRATAIWWATRLDGRGMLKTHSETWTATGLPALPAQDRKWVEWVDNFCEFPKEERMYWDTGFSPRTSETLLCHWLKPRWKTWWFRV